EPDPVYNAIVYVPSAPVAPFSPGISCDKCGAPVSGKPVAVTLTDVKGEFTLRNVPVGKNIPLVIQVGRWRRQVVVPEVGCKKPALPAELTRLPRNSSEGDIPHIAMVTSTGDNTECILRKIGVDESEFTGSLKNGRIHLYHGNGVTIDDTEDASALVW